MIPGSLIPELVLFNDCVKIILLKERKKKENKNKTILSGLVNSQEGL